MTCKDCIHYEVCGSLGMEVYRWGRKPTLQIFLDKYKAEHCTRFKTRSRFVELNIAKKIKHTPDIDKMREFHKLGLGKGMSERSIFWTCSNCKVWVSLAHKFCPNCGAKFEAEVEGA